MGHILSSLHDTCHFKFLNFGVERHVQRAFGDYFHLCGGSHSFLMVLGDPTELGTKLMSSPNSPCKACAQVFELSLWPLQMTLPSLKSRTTLPQPPHPLCPLAWLSSLHRAHYCHHFVSAL